MSMYGDGHYNDDRNYLYDEIKNFLKTHPIYELMDIISNVFEYDYEPIEEHDQ